ncbi:MAG TPA: sigma-70 family RNA polymerase sigma factor [Devosia sp.]|nr:sigma-70 family RNA polymerase sigma factor [Devosia sp.]
MLDKPTSLNPDGVDALIHRWQSNKDERARDQLVRRYLPFIRAEARALARRWHLNMDDAEQDASIGFLRALDKYDPLASKIETYAGWWIKAKVVRGRGAEVTVSVPIGAFNDVGRVARAWKQLKAEGHSPSDVEIGKRAGIGPVRAGSVLFALTGSGRMASMSDPVADAEDMTMEDTIADDDERRPDKRVAVKLDSASARNAIIKVAATLNPRYREVLRLRLVKGMLLEEVAQVMGVTRERIRQIESVVISTLREALQYDPAAMELIGRAPVERVKLPPMDRRASLSSLSQLTGITSALVFRHIEQGRIPRPVGKDQRGRFVWDVNDIRDWSASSPLCARKERTGTEGTIRARELLKTFGWTTAGLDRRIAAGTFPPPIGKAQNVRYWDRGDIEAWRAEHPEPAPLGMVAPFSSGM